MIVPPAYDKGRFYSDILKPSWDVAQEKLSDADRIIVFGYSLPEADMKALKMLLIAFSQNKEVRFDIIDIDESILGKFKNKLQIENINFYKSVTDFVKQNK